MKEAYIIYAIDAILAILVAKLRTDNDPAFKGLIDRIQYMLDENRDPNSEDEAALSAFLAAERQKLHS